MSSFKQLLLGWVALAAASVCFSVHATGTNGTSFGFSGPEIFPINSGISQLHVADFNGDGLKDILVVNNARARINILYNQTGKTNAAANLSDLDDSDINQLPPGSRFQIKSVACEMRISSLVVADLNGDGRPDIAYYGQPKRLVVQYNEGSNNWSEAKSWPIDDGQLSPNALAAGDLNGDGRTDLVLLGESCLYFLPQEKDHSLGEPQKIPFSGTVRAVQVLDVNGDGRSDLLLVNWEDRYPFRFRLQRSNGELGPEIYFPMMPIRSYWADNLEENSQVQVMTIAQYSGRAEVSQFERKPAAVLSGKLDEGQFQVLPLTKTDRARRGLLWADVNGDGLPDLLVAQPDSGQISIYFQQKDGSLSAPRTFPTLADVTDLAVADWNADGKPDIFMLSPDERQVGVAQLDSNEALPFPTLIPFNGKPLVMAVGALHPGAKPTLAVIVDRDGRRYLVTQSSTGHTKTQELSASFTSNPTSMEFHDVDQDGYADLVVLIPYEKVKVLRQVPGKDFQELNVEYPGGAVAQPWMSSLDVDGDGKPELLLPQKNFLRAVVLKYDPSLQTSTNKGGWIFKVKEQINGVSRDSRLLGAAAVRNGTNAIPDLFLLDGEHKELTLCKRDNLGVWRVIKEVNLPVSHFSSLKPIALGGTNVNAVAFMGLNTVAWMPFSGKVWHLTPLDSYETPIKNGYLNDVVSGDLNNDGRKDLVFLETARHFLDLVTFNAQHKLVPAIRWQVFEEHSFRNSMSGLPEPREAAVADVTGDGKNDLIVLVHDRILVYPQE